ncbi:MAG: capsular biosynthesis protein, partial [Bacteroidales bacterium]|nr:capsular biosynthesis protein [Bacteroidales bacterium]
MIFFHNKRACFADLSFVKDCHCHLLPGVDDGADEMNASVQILQRMIDVGVGEVVLTPHINPEIYPNNTEQFLRKRFNRFISELPASVSGLVRISLGGEYMLVDGFEQR